MRDAFASNADRVRLLEFCFAGEGFFRGALILGLQDMIKRIDEDLKINIPHDWRRLTRFYCKKVGRVQRIWRELKSKKEKIALRSESQRHIKDCIQYLRLLERNPDLPESERSANKLLFSISHESITVTGSASPASWSRTRSTSIFLQETSTIRLVMGKELKRKLLIPNMTPNFNRR